MSKLYANLSFYDLPQYMLRENVINKITIHTFNLIHPPILKVLFCNIEFELAITAGNMCKINTNIMRSK